MRRAVGVADGGRSAACRLVGWTAEANHRATSPEGPAVWGLARDPGRRALALALEPGGELMGELEYACAEAVARGLGDPRTARGGRPLAERVHPGRTSRPPGPSIPERRADGA